MSVDATTPVPPTRYCATVIRSPSKSSLPIHLHRPIIQICSNAIKARSAFTIALSGGSLPSVLSTLDSTFQSLGIDPHYDKWHILLADERCVPSTDVDSNLSSLRTNLLSKIAVPEHQIYGIDESLLTKGSDVVAKSYEEIALKAALEKSGGMIDVAVLGFGPDGHTCSLFPSHALLNERDKLVASLDDSPKPPPSRITLTFKVLNELTRNVIFCGAGASKSPILNAVFVTPIDKDHVVKKNNEGDEEWMKIDVTMVDPAPYPCGMVRPKKTGNDENEAVIWVVDADATGGLVE